jgi:hypothetical protein
MRKFRRIGLAVSVVALVPSCNAAAAATGLTHSHARAAACHAWRVTGTWGSVQGNGFHVTFHFTQNGTRISGTSVLPASEAAGAGYATGVLTGTVKANHLNVVTHWTSTTTTPAPIGNYYGTISAHRIVGHGRDVSPGASHTPVVWSAGGKASCVKH